MVSISVCLSSYNGEAYIEKQVFSILEQLDFGDELIICDDGSSDDTVKILKNIKDDRIKLFLNPLNIGYVKSFERALLFSTKEILFLSDQDDIWIPGRVDELKKRLLSAEDIMLVASNFELIDENDVNVGYFNNLRFPPKSKIMHFIKVMLGKQPYYGCTFAFKRELMEKSLPIPKKVESHDIWLALNAILYGRVEVVKGHTLKHRIHDKNVTKKKRSIIKIIVSRYWFLRGILISFLFRAF